MTQDCQPFEYMTEFSLCLNFNLLCIGQ